MSNQQMSADALKNKNNNSEGVAAGMSDGPNSAPMQWQTMSQAQSVDVNQNNRHSLPLEGTWNASRATGDKFPQYGYQAKYDKLVPGFD